ncbi:TPA: flavohemoglobin expression-modulating QEGLA motif protein [Vibrio vulnificus]|nr:flavohemoglobin expression-modulating QEGLA motif protein [Vibrio vulnificus]ELL0585351.1 flavohemoglobin expression-modulating QEGLA motif protein [Vibrio vulnificus]MCU8332536.1 flavohemoglobin expression-modulating QEGLA motif protein [Vibrio vulnificus]MCU8410363.1 flavohemoglobin expression-modulating QEGLA motif protein [Vibrio vulnificus]HAS8111864.1 flavohemoglobin expression-modulating QEGLA motif protein [Vibrio vulnificus]
MLTSNHNQYALEEMLSMIKRGQPFSGELVEGGCFIKIDEYLPVVCTAIHAGHRLRSDLTNQCLLSDSERLFEEDPYTDDMIMSQPIVLIGLDSRFEYDLNRAMTLSTYYKSAWDVQVWKKPLSNQQRNRSHQKHAAFYQLYEALIAKLESLHGMVLVFDVHSYNYKRQQADAPVFNIGTAQIDMERWQSVVKRFCAELQSIALPNLAATAQVNAVFEGRGYLIAHTNAHFDRTLVLPTEVKKVFMEEESGTLFPLVLKSLQSGLKEAFSQTSAFFQRKFNRRRSVSKADMLSSSIEPAVLAVDKALYKLANKVETLKYVNPTNLTAERKRFEAAPNRYTPDYRYRQLPIHANEFKHQLYRLPIETIADPDMRQLYSDMVNNLSEKIDLLTSVGQEAFLYNSLRHYGRPDGVDISNAQFLLYAQTLDEEHGALFTAQQAQTQMQQAAKAWEMLCKVSLSSSLAARAMVSSNPPTLLLNGKVTFHDTELRRLIQHELGVHMATTFNAKMQPLQVFRLGLPGDTLTQEGLAIMAEYHSGYLSHARLQALAVRVLAVDSLLKEHNFYQTFCFLTDELQLERDDAFIITTRVYRGGGFTKDYVYLKGFLAMLDLSKQRSLDNLMIGKCSHRYLDLIDELVERGWLTQPRHRIPQHQGDIEPTLAYLIRSLKH